MFWVALEDHQVMFDLPYSQISGEDAPLEWTSTQLEGAIPDLTYAIGFDVPISMKVKNYKSPKVFIKENELKLNFSVEIDLYDEQYKNLYATIWLNNINLDFNMTLDSTDGYYLILDWN